ncbi:MAG: hypothetical protein IJD59_03445 [Clostridia bacterium]|nr:hypothetical protein [Clostridia bacterium]
MKKLFALLLAFTLLFLTACNNKPADSTTGTGTGTGNPQNPVTPNELELKDTIICKYTRDFIDLPSRVIYEGSGGLVHYYSKADGKAYVYCFDPLCEHDDGYCLAAAWKSVETLGFNFGYTFFINNRFYGHTGFGQIISFSFDGTDKKIEYDAEYDNDAISGNPWGHCIAIGPYIYIDLRSYASEDGKAHTLRFNVETGEMEDLTEKTGNYMYPSFFYNGMIYGYDHGSGYLKADLDLNSYEEIERIPYSNHFSGSRFLNMIRDQDGIYKTHFYDMKTGTTEMHEIPGLTIDGSRVLLYADENYLYFYKYEEFLLGEVWFRGELKPTYKYNDGSIYRVNHDGTGLVCIYEESEFNITGREAIIIGDQFLVEGKNVRVRDNQTETWDSGLLVGTIGADGKIDELKPVEVVE